MDWIVRLPSALYRLSVKKAGTDRELQAHIRQYLEAWTEERTTVRTLDGQTVDAWGGPIVVTKVKPWSGGTVFCPDCQQVHTPGPCPRVT